MEKLDVDQEVADRVRILHYGSAQLDHHIFSAKFTDVAQGFDQNLGLADLFLVIHQHHPL